MGGAADEPVRALKGWRGGAASVGSLAHDDYLELVAARLRRNSVLAIAFDVKLFAVAQGFDRWNSPSLAASSRVSSLGRHTLRGKLSVRLRLC